MSDVAEILVVFRERQADGSGKHDYLLSNGPVSTPLADFARVFKAQHRVEECLQRAKGEAGLVDYAVHTWRGWYHHQARALVATWLLTREPCRGKKWTPALMVPQVQELIAGGVAAAVGDERCGVQESHRQPAFAPA
jgi:hypothetical protein